jgi:phosphate starvation-inducible PhoH-like protein
VSGRTPNQTAYIKTILSNDITLAYGPAGTGKTHIAIGMAVYALKNAVIERIILCRPAVDSGASIGFLPGTMEEKIGPYLAPLFDELNCYVEAKHVKAMMEHKTLEIVPLPFMRGRTFNNACVILDEAQNATMPELRMFLTRIGLNSRMIVVGDLEQTDLPREQQGAFENVIDSLEGMDGVGIAALDSGDIVRHRIISEVIRRLSNS